MDNTVIITGAGFSAPAKVPIQNSILNEIVSKPEHYDEIDQLNNKFLTSYIEVGLYLLDEYFGIDTSDQYLKYQKKNYEYNYKLEMNQLSKSLKMDYISFLIKLKEKVRQQLEEEQLANRCISLEDVFTSLDKAVIKRIHNKKNTYIQLDNIRHSILRLFVYYFEKCIQKHNCTLPEYLSIIEFIKSTENVSFITTNWDTIFEKYMDVEKVKYNLCFSDMYYKYDKSHYSKKSKMPFIKIHGSLDWYRCLSCDTLLILKKKTNKRFIFDDEAEEKCISCNTIAQKDCVQLEPEIITPTMIKSISGQLYANLWKSAADKLSLANKVIFIGYSLPVADYEFRYLLKRSLRRTARIDVILIEKDDPSKISRSNNYLKGLLPQTRYEELFGTQNTHFYYDGFQSYFS